LLIDGGRAGANGQETKEKQCDSGVNGALHEGCRRPDGDGLAAVPALFAVNRFGRNAMDELHTGSCNCRAVRFTTHGPLREVIYCHCTQCRKQSGHFFAATSVANDRINIEGEDDVSWYAASEEGRRGFCRTCGSALFWRQIGAPTISILAGAFDSPTGLKGGMHIFVGDRGDYYDIDDGLPRHDAW